MEEDGTGAAPQLTPFQQEVLNAVAAYEHKFTARALTDFVRGTVGQVSRALDALCDADIVTRGGSGADELFWTGEEPDGEPIMEPGAAPAGWQQPPRPQQSGGRAKAPAKTKTASKRRAGAPKKESDMDRFRREGKALFDSMPRVDGGLALAPGYAGDLRAEDTWTAPPTDPFPDDPTAIPSQQERDAAYARAKNAFLLLDYNKDDQYRCEVPDALAKGKEFDGDPRMPNGALWNDWLTDARAMAKAQPRLGAKGNLKPPDWFLGDNLRLSPRAVMAFLGGDGSLSFTKKSGLRLSIGLKCTFENIIFLLAVRRCIGTGGVTVCGEPTDNYYVTVTYRCADETVQKFVATHCYDAVPRGDIMALARLSLRYCRVRVSRDPERMQREEQAKLQAKKVLAFVSNAANKKKDLPDEGTPERITRFENQLKAGGKAAFMEWFAFFVLADGSVMIGGEYKIEFFQSDKSFLEAVKRVLKTYGFGFALYDNRLDSFAGDGYDRRKPFTGSVRGGNAKCHELAKALLPFYQGHWDQVHHTAKAVALMASSKKPGDVRKDYDQLMIGVSDSIRAAAKKRKRRRAPAPAPARAPAPAVPVPAPAAPPPGTLDEGWGITPLNFAALESLLS